MNINKFKNISMILITLIVFLALPVISNAIETYSPVSNDYNSCFTEGENCKDLDDDTDLVVDGEWRAVDEVTRDTLGYTTAFAEKNNNGLGGWRNYTSNYPLLKWVEQFNGNWDFVSNHLELNREVQDSQLNTEYEFYIRDVVKLCGGYIPDFDANTNKYWVVRTEGPGGGIYPTSWSVKAGEETTIKINPTSNVPSWNYPGTDWEFYVDGSKVDSGSESSNSAWVEIDYTFPEAKTYTLELEIKDGVEREHEVALSFPVSAGSIPPPPPPPSGDSGVTAYFSISSSCIVGDTLTTDNQSAASGGNYIAASEWEVSPYADVDVDSPNSTDTDITFDKEGAYDVTLKVWDNECNEDSMTKTVFVQDAGPPPPPPPPPNSPPTARIDMTSHAKQGDTVDVENKSYDDGDIVNVDWDITPSSGVSENLGFDGGTITFNKEGIYTVELEVEDDEGDNDIDTETIEISNKPPVAKINMMEEVMQGEDFEIESESYDPDGSIVSYNWNVTPSGKIKGDTLSGEETTVYFDEEGDYEVELIVEDDFGKTDSVTESITVKPAIPEAFFDWIGDAKENRKITLDAADSYTSNRYPIIWEQAQWEYITPSGVSQDVVKVKDTGTLENREILFKEQGIYTVKLKVKNTAGHCSEWYSQDIEIKKDEKPVADFKVLNMIKRNPENNNKAEIELNGLSYSPDGDNITSRIWKYKYDSDNDNSFADEDWQVLDSGNNINPILYTTEVGNYKFRLEIEESFGKPTISEFVTADDRKKDDTTDKAISDTKCEVINTQPMTSFKPIATKKAECIFITMQDTGITNIENKVLLQIDPKLQSETITADNKFYGGITSSTWAIVGEDSGWGMTGAWAGFLEDRKIPYDKVSISQMGSVNLSKYSHMIMTGDQPPGFYSKIRDNKNKYENWVQNGGILFFERTDGGWNSSRNSDDGNIFGWRWHFDTERNNYVEDSSHPIVEGVSCSLSGNYASHGYFENLPSGYNTILKGGVHPTLVEFDYGNGTVIASGNPLEFYITGHGSNNNSWGKISNNIINYMKNTQAFSISSVLNKITFDKHAKSYVVLIADGEIHELGDPIQANLIISKLMNNNVKFMVLGSNNNQTQMENFINKNNNAGTFFTNNNIDNVLDDTANYIINDFITADDDIASYILLDSSIEYGTYYKDEENDTEIDRRWKYTHDDDFYDNSLGIASYNDQYISNSIKTFSKTGKFNVIFNSKDNPKDDDNFEEYRKWSANPPINNIIYVHRRPIADFKVNLSLQGSYYNVTSVDNMSYDKDHETEPDKGITQSKWKWRNFDEINWNSGLPLQLEAGQKFLFSLEVKDTEGVWSYPVVKAVNTSSLNMKPIAEFVVNPQPLPLGKQLSYDTSGSYDPDTSDYITLYQWKYKKVGEGWSVPENDKPNYPITFDEIGEYKVELIVRDSNGVWSEPRTRTIDVIPANTKPIADFSIVHDPLPQDVEQSYNDNSFDPDGDNIVAWEWQYNKDGGSWQNGQPVKFETLGVGNYNISLRVKDQPALVVMTPLWSDWHIETLQVVPGNQKPAAQFNVSPNPAIADQSVSYNDNSYDPDGAGISERIWRIEDMDGNILGEYHDILPPTIFSTTGWGDFGAGQYKIGLRVKDNSPNGISPALWSDWTYHNLTVILPLEGTGEITPNPALSGYKIDITIDTEGYAEEVYVDFPNDVYWNNDRVYLTPDYPISSRNNTWKARYTTEIKTPDGIYNVDATVRRISIAPETIYIPLISEIRGNIYDQIKVRIRESR